jgi:hypothetical protein
VAASVPGLGSRAQGLTASSSLYPNLPRSANESTISHALVCFPSSVSSSCSLRSHAVYSLSSRPTQLPRANSSSSTKTELSTSRPSTASRSETTSCSCKSESLVVLVPRRMTVERRCRIVLTAWSMTFESVCFKNCLMMSLHRAP